MKRLLKDKRGEGFVDVCVLVLAIAMVLALVVRIAPVFVAKQNLDVFADELVRTAEINGQVGSATNAKAADLREQTGEYVIRPREHVTRPQYLMERHRKNPARQRGGSDPHNHRQYWAVR